MVRNPPPEDFPGMLELRKKEKEVVPKFSHSKHIIDAATKIILKIFGGG